MPIYSFQCPSEHEFEGFLVKFDSPNPVCEECGQATERIWRARGARRAASGFPFTTTHLNGKPIEVTSESHLQSLCKQYGVTHRPDNGFIEKRVVGTDWRTGKQIWAEGSGRGMKGSWI